MGILTFEVSYFRVYNAPMRIVALFALAIFFPVFAHASIVINEIMYNPAGSGGAQWIELYNSSATSVTMVAGNKSSAWHVDDGSSSRHYLIDPSSGTGRGSLVIPASGFVVITNDPTGFVAKYDGSYSVIKSALSLKTAGGTVTVYDESGTQVGTTVTYDKAMGGYNDDNTLQLSGGSWTAVAPTPGATNVGGSSGSSGSDSTSSDTSSDATSTPVTTPASGAPPEYIPIPTLRIVTNGDKTVSSGADTAFTAVVYDGKGNRRDEALVLWSFGDGMQRNGANVYHTYYYPGEYVAVVRVSTPDGGDAFVESIITVKDASIKIDSVSVRGISLTNNSSRTLDLSLWRLSMGGKEFKIPTGTQILAGRTTMFPSQIIQLPISNTASLLYPSGEVSATYTSGQPSTNAFSYKQVSEVEPAISAKASVPANEKAVIAPSVATELAAVGASVSELPKPQPKSNGLFSSPWFYSMLGVMALAGVAFIFI